MCSVVIFLISFISAVGLRLIRMRIYWGWVVCVAFLILFTLISGMAFSFSEMIIPLSHDSNTSMSALTWLGSMPACLPMLGAPIANWLHYRIPDRYLVIAGVILTSLSLMVMPLIDNVIIMLSVFAIVGSFGILLIANPPFFLIESYFPYEHPRHVLATSIVACGFPLATLIFNPLTYALIALIGWRWTYGLYAIVVLVLGLACAITFRPNTAEELEEELNKTRTTSKREDSDEAPLISSKINDTQKGYENMSLKKSANETDHSPDRLEGCTSEAISERDTESSKCEKMELENNAEQNETSSLKDDNKEIGKPMVALMWILWFLASFCKCMAYYTPLLVLVKQMELMEISHSSASRVMSLIGFCEVISRLLTSYLGDYIKGKTLYMYVVFTLLLCAQNALAILASTYTHILIYSITLGIFGGPTIAAMYSSGSEVLCGAYVPELFSVFRVALGIGSIVGPTVSGIIYDATGSFVGIFYINCAGYALSALFYALIPLLHRTRHGCNLFCGRQNVSSRGYASISSSGSASYELLK